VSRSIANPGALLPDRHRQGDFFLCGILDTIPKDNMATMEHPIFSLSTRPDRRNLRYAYNDVEIEVTPSVKGLARIHDKDIPIYCISQLMALNAGKTVSRRPHGQRGGDALGLALSGGDGEIRPDAEPGLFPPQKAAGTPHLRNSTQALRPPGQLARLGRSAAQEIRLGQPAARPSQDVARHDRGGSPARLRDGGGGGRHDTLLLARCGDRGPGSRPPVLPPEAHDAARALAPGWDVHALEAEWRSFWATSGGCAAKGAARLGETARGAVWPEVIWFAKTLSITRLWKVETSCR